jgi:exonuclease SbcC
MKILKIRFKNINSLKGEHEINFDKKPFNSGSLFAITGPTGSGKSTILDVISLALFNQIPRLGTISKNELTKTGAVITKNQTEAWAEVSYACKAGTYTSKWFIHYNRNNKLNDYGMELAEFETGKILDFKKSEVPNENQRLVGLNYDQFIKSIVLAQGEFAQFLKEKKEKRAELLEKITGTGIYRKLGIAAFEKFKSVNDSIKEKQAEIVAINSNLLEEEAFEQLKKQLSHHEKESNTLDQGIKKTEGLLSLKQSILTYEKEIKTLQDRTKISRITLAEFQEQHGIKIQKHEELQPFTHDLRLLTSKHERLHETEGELKEVQEKIVENTAKESSILEQTKALCQTELEPANVVQELEAFYEKVSDLQKQVTDKRQDYSVTLDQMNRELQDIAFQYDPKNAEKSLADLEDLDASKTRSLKELEASMQEINLQHLSDARRMLQERITFIIQAQQAYIQIKEIRGSIEREEQKYEKLSKEEAEYPSLIEKIEKDIELSSEKLLRLRTEKENNRLKAELNEHRKDLVPHEPCPLCGSKEHPYAGDEIFELDELSVHIQEQQKILEQQQERRAKYKSQLSSLQGLFEASIQEKKQFEEQLFQKQELFESYARKLNIEKDAKIDWEEMKLNTQSQLESIDSIEQLRHQNQSIKAAIALHRKLNQILLEGKLLDQKLKELYTGENIYKESRSLIDQWKANQQEKESLHERTQALNTGLKKLRAEIEALETDLLKALNAICFKTIEEAQASLLEDGTYLQLRNEREQYQKQLNAGLEQLQLLSKQLAELKKQDPEESLEEMQNQLAAQNEQRTGLQKILNEIRAQIRTQENYLKQLRDLKKAIAETEKKNLKWKLLNELIGDARGKKFNDFAQDLSLSQLIILANRRLQDLSDRYLLDKADLEVEDDSLVAIDSHMGGQRRSVKTLSGGETFILSLSMALALSDLASKNVKIHSLFIDEGFGTLDPETLDQTLDTLEKLQAESSKTIGIISHVDSLKERIRTQIQLSRNGQGYSKIEIKG